MAEEEAVVPLIEAMHEKMCGIERAITAPVEGGRSGKKCPRLKRYEATC